jgi:hypothetical protein
LVWTTPVAAIKAGILAILDDGKLNATMSRVAIA